MLKKENRLNAHSAFIATYKQYNSISNNLLILNIGKLKDESSKDNPTRVGFVVSKKISKRAVKRNRIKRLMRENIRLILKKGEYPALNKYVSLIFSAREMSLDKNYNEISDSVKNLLNRL